MKARPPETERLAGLRLVFGKFQGWADLDQIFNATPFQVASSRLELMRLLDILKSQGLIEQHAEQANCWRMPSLLDSLAQAAVEPSPPEEVLIEPSVADGAVAHFEWLLTQGALTREDEPHIENLRKLADNYRRLRKTP